MKPSDIRNWLGIYFLLTTSILGAYILLFGETAALPIKKKDALDAFQIIVPVFVAQLTTVFTWYSQNFQVADDSPTNIPSWMVKLPPSLVLAILTISVVAMIISEHSSGSSGWLDAATFKGLVTFCVTLLNATSVLVVSRFFGKKT